MLNIRANYIYRGSLIVIFFLFNQFGHGGRNILPILKMSHKNIWGLSEFMKVDDM